MKVLKGIGFLLLAALVCAGFITAYSTVPMRFEESARAVTLERLEKSGETVDQAYVEASIETAVHDNLHTIYRTAITVSLAVALIICLASIRPPHDCGGINLFNPLAIPLVAFITVFMAVGISLALDAVQGRAVTEFIQLTSELKDGCSGRWEMLLISLFIPLALEAIFRGYIFSFLEKLHFTVAIVLSTAAYGAIAYYCFSSYAVRSIGSTAGANTAAFIALFIGFVHAVITWRLRSCIPAVLSHVFIANSEQLVTSLRARGGIALPHAIIVLAVSLALLVFLPVLFAKRVPLFAEDFPFTRHHKRMYKWLEGKKAAKKKSGAERGSGQSAERNSDMRSAEHAGSKAASKPVSGVKKAVNAAVDAEHKAAKKVSETVKRSINRGNGTSSSKSSRKGKPSNEKKN